MSETIFQEDSKGEENATSEERGQEGSQGREEGSTEGSEEAGSEAGGEGDEGQTSDQASSDNSTTEVEAEETKKEEETASEEEVDSEEAEYEFELPEDSYLSEDYLQELASFAEEKGFSKEQAQEIAVRESNLVDDTLEVAMKTYQEDSEKQLQEASEKWVEELKSDPEIGGDKAGETAELYKRFAEHYFPENLRNWLAETGLGNNYSLVKALRAAAIDLQMGDDSIERGGNITRSKQKSDSELFYPEEKTN
jgi:hypothetical protein